MWFGFWLDATTAFVGLAGGMKEPKMKKFSLYLGLTYKVVYLAVGICRLISLVSEIVGPAINYRGVRGLQLHTQN